MATVNALNLQPMTASGQIWSYSSTSPSSATPITLTAGTGMSIVNGDGSITVTCTVVPTPNLPLTVETSYTVPIQMDTNNAYVANVAATQVVFDLPPAPAVGDTIAVGGVQAAGGWQIAIGPGQNIQVGITTGTTSLTSAQPSDGIKLYCIAAGPNSNWLAIETPQGSPVLI